MTKKAIFLLITLVIASILLSCMPVVNGVRAALAAGMDVVAIATPFTNAGLHSSEIIEDVWIVHEPEKVAEIVRQRIEKHNRIAPRNSQVEQKGEV